jgi:hypothetical protein
MGLSSDDVFACDDLLQLEEWLMQQQMDVAAIDMQLLNAKQYYDDTGEYENTQHFNKMQKAKLLQGNLYSLLKKKIEMIKDERESLDSALIKIMRENITDEHWNELVDEAKLRLKCERQ